MSERRRIRSAAKVNLALKVLDRRPDGYHELDTVFQTIDLWDTLEVGPAPDLTLRCDAAGVPTDRSNLVLRAAELVRSAGRCSDGAELILDKGIPVQAGLGGGSSDAAAALVLCRDYWGIDLPDAALYELAVELGADVPFFLTGGTARGRGRGDRIESLPPLREAALLLGVPPFGIATAGVFGQVAERLTLPGNGVNLPPLSAHKWPEGNDFSFAVNDLEEIVFPDRPELEEFKDVLLTRGAAAALLSGSGSTVFGVFPDGRGLEELARSARKRFVGWRVIASRAVPAAMRWVD